jgi:hypothetical protein
MNQETGWTLMGALKKNAPGCVRDNGIAEENS